MDIELVRNGGLTADGRALTAHLSQRYETVKDQLENLPDKQARGYFVLVSQLDYDTPAEFFATYPSVAAKLWRDYISSLPVDDPRRVLDDLPAPTHESFDATRAALMPLAAARELPDLHFIKASLRQTPLAMDGRLTWVGDFVIKTLSAELSKDTSPGLAEAVTAPYKGCLRTYSQFVETRLQTPAQFFESNPSIAAELACWAVDSLSANYRTLTREVTRMRLSTVSADIRRL